MGSSNEGFQWGVQWVFQWAVLMRGLNECYNEGFQWAVLMRGFNGQF